MTSEETKAFELRSRVRRCPPAMWSEGVVLVYVVTSTMTTESPLDIVPGQFDDASEDTEHHNPRQGGHYIDDDQLLEWSEPSEDELSGDDFGHRVEDEDWEIAERGGSAFDTSVRLDVRLVHL